MFALVRAPYPQITEGAEIPAANRRQMGLGAVLHDGDPVFARELHERRHVDGITAVVHRHDRLCVGRDARGDGLDVHEEAVRHDIGEHGNRVQLEDADDAAIVCQGADDHLIAGTNTGSVERHVNGRRS